MTLIDMLPIFSRPYRVLSYKVFNRLKVADVLSKYFESIKPMLHKAQLYMTIEEYISTALFTVLITAPFVFIITRLVLMEIYDFLSFPALLMGILSVAVYTMSVLMGFFVYPQYKVDNIRRNIELNLPYATTHMATIAGTGVPIYLMFRIIGDFPEYGEISRESRRISRNIELFGYDTITALSESAAETPSTSFKDLLWGVVAVIRSGGDMRMFLMEKAHIYMENQKNLESEYIDTLELMAEMYTTIFVAGPVLFVVMATIIGSMGSIPIDLGLLFMIVIYIMMPLLAVGFMTLIEGSKPIGA